MSRTIFDLYNFSQYLTRKERGIFQSVPQFNQNLTAAQLDAIEEYFRMNGPDNPIHDAIRPFQVYQPFTSAADGFVTFPTNYLHRFGTSFTVTGSTVNEIKFVQPTEVAFALKSQLRPASTSYPIAVDTSTGFSIYPQTTQTGFYWYLKNPTAPVLAVTQVGRTITYDAGNSVQLTFSEAYWNNVLAKSLRYVGIYMSEDEISKFADSYNKETE